MKTIFPILFFLLTGMGAAAQRNMEEITQLVSLKSGLSKQAVADSLKNIKPLSILSDRTMGNKTIITCRLAKSEDMGGREAFIYLTFLNGLLSDGYLQATFKRADFYDLEDNFRLIRAYLNENWEKEKEKKTASANLVSTGYEYSKAKHDFQKNANINLQYIYSKPGKGEGVYMLRLGWISSIPAENILY